MESCCLVCASDESSAAIGAGLEVAEAAISDMPGVARSGADASSSAHQTREAVYGRSIVAAAPSVTSVWQTDCLVHEWERSIEAEQLPGDEEDEDYDHAHPADASASGGDVDQGDFDQGHEHVVPGTARGSSAVGLRGQRAALRLRRPPGGDTRGGSTGRSGLVTRGASVSPLRGSQLGRGVSPRGLGRGDSGGAGGTGRSVGAGAGAGGLSSSEGAGGEEAARAQGQAQESRRALRPSRWPG